MNVEQYRDSADDNIHPPPYGVNGRLEVCLLPSDKTHFVIWEGERCRADFQMTRDAALKLAEMISKTLGSPEN